MNSKSPILITIVVLAFLITAGFGYLTWWGTKATSYARLSKYALKGNDTALTQMISHGADVNYTYLKGCPTVLAAAITGRHPSTVRLLLVAGADPNAVDEMGRSPLRTAISGKNADPKIVQALIDYGAKVDKGFLLIAVLKQNVPITKKILSTGVDPNLTLQDGATLLMLAAKAGNTELLTALIQAGADVTRKDKKGEDAISIARKNGHAQAAAVLEKYRHKHEKP